MLDAMQARRRQGADALPPADLTPTGACRMCVVEVEGQRNLVAEPAPSPSPTA
jgi:predicted molibdopterin-dependent oxidoreductase YjgC